MSIEKSDTFEQDFNCRVSTLEELVEVLQAIQSKHPDAALCTYEHETVELYLDEKGRVSFS